LYLEFTQNVCLTDFGTTVDYSDLSQEVPNILGWVNMLGCRTPKEFIEIYNKWNLEVWFRFKIYKSKNTKQPIEAFYIEKNSKTKYKFEGFDFTLEQRENLEGLCKTKIPNL
jgi:hypothetical protein